MELPRIAELQWQGEVIKVGLNISNVPQDARTELVEMLKAVKKEIEELRYAM